MILGRLAELKLESEGRQEEAEKIDDKKNC